MECALEQIRRIDEKNQPAKRAAGSLLKLQCHVVSVGATGCQFTTISKSKIGTNLKSGIFVSFVGYTFESHI